METLIEGRCSWCAGDDDYIAYHVNEWGRFKTDEKELFEMIVLEGAQAGLNWLTILKRREDYRKAFHQFEPEKVAIMTDEDVERLMLDAGIIRNRLKIKSAITNASAFMRVQEEFGSFFSYIESFLPDGRPIVKHFKSLSEIPASTELSDRISRDMKRRGFKFFGTTICYAFLQSSGFVNDHLIGCKCRK
nr:methyladenine glycosylase [uncultured bacterium]AMP55575.1 methyladenine glycosylase [uncultured bacterium]AMP55601.1 methyladenine glycosylase [uncultured bacterium]